jgi:branched-chain amino acid transport system ATP-binding protein
MMLRICDIETFYANIKALKGVSVELDEGEIVTLIGANGAGKTTTLKTISGLLRPRKGTIEFMGQRIDRLRSSLIARLGIAHCPEGRKIFPRMTVFENLELGTISLTRKGDMQKQLDFVYHHFPVLKERKNQLAGSLSGGEQQMLAIGRALMAAPKLLLLDEPSMGLSPLLVKEIFEIITNIHKEGTSILLVEQNANLALNFAKRGYVLETGKVVIQDTCSALLKDETVKKAYLGGEA